MTTTNNDDQPQQETTTEATTDRGRNYKLTPRRRTKDSHDSNQTRPYNAQAQRQHSGTAHKIHNPLHRLAGACTNTPPPQCVVCINWPELTGGRFAVDRLGQVDNDFLLIEHNSMSCNFECRFPYRKLQSGSTVLWLVQTLDAGPQCFNCPHEECDLRFKFTDMITCVFLFKHMAQSLLISMSSLSYKAYIRPTTEYAIPVWMFCLRASEAIKLKCLQASACKVYLTKKIYVSFWLDVV